MTRDEVIKLAREADMIDFRDDDSDLHVAQFIDFLEFVICKAVAAEREACANVCQQSAEESERNRWTSRYTAAECRRRIRARGEKGQS